MRLNYPAAIWHLGAYTITFLFAATTFTRAGITLAIVLHVLCGAGITLGAHRTFSHPGTFAKTRRFKRLMAILYVLSFDRCGQGLLSWVAQHTDHHQHADRIHDPHSPHQGGIFHAFCGHHLYRDPIHWDRKHYGDRMQIGLLSADPVIWLADSQRVIWTTQLTLLVALASLGFLAGGPRLAASFVVWGVFVRWSFTQTLHGLLDVCNHGAPWPFSRLPDTYRTRCRAVNQYVLWPFQLGNETSHNRHHAWPNAAGEVLTWKLWRQDADALGMRLLEWLGIIKGCQWITREQLQSRAGDWTPATTSYSAGDRVQFPDGQQARAK